IPFESARFSIDPGDALVLYTDGITEAFDPQREQFGTSRLDEAVLEGSGNPDLVVDAVFSGLYRHVGAMTRDDDQTLVVLQRELASDA
ncbi:MAG: SpoIIE family protein phosphatase, partial [Planctomycetota bacterium]